MMPSVKKIDMTVLTYHGDVDTLMSSAGFIRDHQDLPAQRIHEKYLLNTLCP